MRRVPVVVVPVRDDLAARRLARQIPLRPHALLLFETNVAHALVRAAEIADRIRAVITEFKVDDRCQKLYESYKEEAIRALVALENPSLKGLLRRVITKIFNDLEVKGWCSEFEARNAAGRAAGAQAVG